MTNKQILHDFFERVWNGRDLDAVDELIAPEYTIHSDPGDPWDGQTLDPAGFKERLEASIAPFPDLTFEVGEMLADGDRVAVSWRMTGTQAGEIPGVPGTGHAIDTPGITIYYFRDGRIAGHRQAMDRVAVMQQMGLLREA